MCYFCLKFGKTIQLRSYKVRFGTPVSVYDFDASQSAQILDNEKSRAKLPRHERRQYSMHPDKLKDDKVRQGSFCPLSETFLTKSELEYYFAIVSKPLPEPPVRTKLCSSSSVENKN